MAQRRTRQERIRGRDRRSAEEERADEVAQGEGGAFIDEVDELDEAGAVDESDDFDDFDDFDDEPADSRDIPIPEGRELTREERLERVERSKARRRRKKIAHRVVWALIGLLAVGIIAACVAFAVFRWQTYDDAADIQGQWRIVGTEKIIEITPDTIVLTDDVAYKYTLDPQAKTITFKFGNMTGHARYRFSLDRQLLSITDGEYEWMDTLGDDILWTLGAWFVQLTGNGAQMSPGEGVLVTELTRQLVPSADEQEPAEGAEGGGGAGVPDEGGGEAADQGSDPGDAPDDSSSEDATASSGSGSSSSSSSGTRDVDELDLSDLREG